MAALKAHLADLDGDAEGLPDFLGGTEDGNGSLDSDGIHGGSPPFDSADGIN
jgi:hypothetical protein